MQKTKELIELEKIFQLEITDFTIENDNIECITFENTEISTSKIEQSIKFLTYLKRLFIFNCKIESTSFLNNLNNLEGLTINNSDLTRLDINNLDNKIKSLSLTENKIEDISFISKLKKLQNLSLDNNIIKDISPLKDFTEFEEISLKNNQIEDINPLIKIEIGELFIGGNNIIDLSPLYHSLKNKKIKFINAFENPLVYPPQDIVIRGEENIIKWFNMISDNIKICKQKIEEAKINNEKKLDLGMMGLTDLSLIPELFELEKLEELILSNHYAEYNEEARNWDEKHSDNNFYPNNLTHIPLEIKKLKKLKKLIIGGDWKDGDKWNKWRIKDIIPIFSLKNLEFLNVSNNNIEKIIVKNSQKLPKLKVIHLNNNKLTTFNTLTKFSNLEELYLSNNKLNTVTNLKSILTLKTIDLHRNNIRSIKPLLNLLEKTEINITDSKWKKNTINIKDNPLKEPNYETINTGKEAVIRYFESEWKTIVNKEIKLVLVGNSEVGKTTLVKYLDGEKDLNKSHEATHWMIEKDISSKNIIKKLGEKCNIRVFDFGGQDYYHDTHQIFFTKNTIYFLLWEEKTNNLEIRQLHQKVNGKEKNVETQDYPVEYWLESIKHFIKEKSNIIVKDTIKYEYDSSVLMIQNKVSKADEIKHLNNLALTDEKKYPFIYDFINIDILKDKRNLKHFDFLLSEIINEMKTIGSEILEYQHIIRNKLKDYSEKQILNFKEFTEYCNRNLTKKISENEAKDLCSYLKQLGLIFYLPDYSKIYLNKKWVFDSIYKILDGLFEFYGEFDEKYISHQLGLNSNDGLIAGLLVLMKEFKIIFHNPFNNKYIAPLYLPKEPSEGVGLFLLENRVPYRRFEYNGFIHKTFILDFFNKYGEKTIGDTKKFYYWKDGLIIKDDKTEQILHIKFKNGNNKEERNAHIDIFKLNYNDKEDIFISEVINYIKEINNKFFKLDNKDIQDKKIDIEDYYEEMVTINNEDFVSLKLINENAEKGKIIFRERKLIEVQNQINIEQNDINLSDYKQFLDNKNMMKKIFISYSKDDLEIVMSFINSLQSLVIDGIIDQPWYCTYLQPGDEVHNKIREKMAEADIICFMCSNNFYKTKYIIEYELKPTIQKYNSDKKQIILPIIIDRCRWILDKPEINLGNFSGFPYRGKPVVSFYNWNDAWYVTNYFLEQVIKKQLNNNDKLFDSTELSNDISELLKLQANGSLNS